MQNTATKLLTPCRRKKGLNTVKTNTSRTSMAQQNCSHLTAWTMSMIWQQHWIGVKDCLFIHFLLFGTATIMLYFQKCLSFPQQMFVVYFSSWRDNFWCLKPMFIFSLGCWLFQWMLHRCSENQWHFLFGKVLSWAKSRKFSPHWVHIIFWWFWLSIVQFQLFWALHAKCRLQHFKINNMPSSFIYPLWWELLLLDICGLSIHWLGNEPTSTKRENKCYQQKERSFSWHVSEAQPN